MIVFAMTISLRSAQGSRASDQLDQAHAQWADRTPENPGVYGNGSWRNTGMFCSTGWPCARRGPSMPFRRRPTGPAANASCMGPGWRMPFSWAWPRCSAENYFGKISKVGILAALAEIKGAVAPAWHKAKKSELVASAEREVVRTGLPQPIMAVRIESDCHKDRNSNESLTSQLFSAIQI